MSEMDSKKRGHKLVDGVEAQLDTATDGVVCEPTIKKMKKEKKKKKSEDVDMADGSEAPSPASNSMKPMERRKQRKALDKERHRAASKTVEIKPKPEVLQDIKPDDAAPAAHAGPSSPRSVLPEFHISVFKDLASADAPTRETAAEAMVTELCQVQEAYDRMETKEIVKGGLLLEAEKDDGLNDCAPALRYAVRRLIRGVSSSRECARPGFALALTLLVSRVSLIKVESFLKLVADSLEVSSSMKGQEARDCLLGCLFAYGALARSGRLTKEWNSDKNTTCIKEFISLLISLAAKKRYLQEPSVAVILELMEQLPMEALLNHVVEVSALQEWFNSATEAGNPDALLLALHLRENISTDVNFGKLLPCPFTLSKLFNPEHLASLVDCLKESTFCQPRVHSVWHILVKTLLPDEILQDEDVTLNLNPIKKLKKGRKSSSSEEEAATIFQSFCEVIIEGSLLLSSHDRKHLAFDILLLLLPRIPVSFVPIVLSHKVVQCLMDILSTKDSWLYKVAQHFLKGLSDWVRDSDARRVAVIMSIQKHSNGKFDCITRTKTVKDFMAEFQTESGCMLFVQNLMSLFVDESHASEEPSDQSQTTDENSEIDSNEDKDSAGPSGNSEFLKSWVVESLPNVLKYLKLDPEAKFRVQKEIIKFLTVQGIFSALGTEVGIFGVKEKFKWPKTPTSIALCRRCIDQLQSLLASAQKAEGSLAMANGLEVNDIGSYFMRFFSTLRSIPSVKFFHEDQGTLPLSNEDKEALEKLQAVEAGLCREERNCKLGTDANRLHALRYLLIQLVLQVVLRRGDLSETALEIVICCKKAYRVSDHLDSTEEDDFDVDGPSVMDVLVETFLSMLPQASAPMRSAIEQVFKYFGKDVTDEGLLRMLRVIKKDLKPGRHQEVESDDDDEDFLGIEEDEESDEEEMGETVESDGQTDDSEAVLRANASGEGLPEDSDEGFDDETMFRLDAQLVRFFKERKNQTGSDTAHSQFAAFKLRVLSLLEIFLHENPADPRVLTVYSNLAQAFVNPRSAEGKEHFEQRIWGILQKKILKAKDFPKGEDVQLSTLESLLEKNLKLASRPFKKKKSANNTSSSSRKQSPYWNRHKMIVSLAQESTYWILKIIDSANFPESELKSVYDSLRGVLTSYFESKKCQLKSEFLKEIIRRRPWLGHYLFGFLLENCGGARLEFRRVEGLDLVTEILKLRLSSSTDAAGKEQLRKFLKNNLRELCHMIKEFVTDMPTKASRRVEVRKCLGRIFHVVSLSDLKKSFLKLMDPDVHSACQSLLGGVFTDLKEK